MNCGYSKELLALYVEGDLEEPLAVSELESHITQCTACASYCGELRKTQSFVKGRFDRENAEAVTPDALAQVRRGVMSQIGEVERSLGWTLRFERFFITAFRSHRYATAGFVVTSLVAALLIGRIPWSARTVDRAAASFAVNDTLRYPDHYQEWVLAGYSSEHKVYIDPAAYREFKQTGTLPEGTVFVRESLSDEGKLQVDASVKDAARFTEGWGFYSFADASSAAPLAETAACLACHRERAGGDYVFTEF
jgi:hypothetical protein